MQQASAVPPSPALGVRGVSRRFGATLALDAVDLDVEAGQVHALVGANGAGKSTILGIAAGRIPATSGTVELFGRPLPQGDPRGCRRAGLVAIYQELTIAPALSAQANVFLGHPQARRGVLHEREMRRRYLELCAQTGVRAFPDVPARRLSVADQQQLEILRALVVDARIVLFDEPTAALAEHEREAFFAMVGRLVERGVTCVLVSHNLGEVLAHSDVVSVFRDGRVEATAPRTRWDHASLVAAMLGPQQERSTSVPDRSRRRRPAAPATAPPPRLVADDLALPGRLHGVSFSAGAGEVLGVAGLVGSGRTSLLRTLAGLEPRAHGALRIEGRASPVPGSVRAAHRVGIALIPEDRKTEGLALALSGQDNMLMSDFASVARHGVVHRRRSSERARALAGRFALAPDRVAVPAGALSGGNQQKLMLARWAHRRPAILLADEPTRGVDVGAKQEILSDLRRAADGGLTVLVASAELDEVVAIADRVIVLAHGRLAGTLDTAREQITVAAILELAFGADVERAA